jgi:hypothetical protein
MRSGSAEPWSADDKLPSSTAPDDPGVLRCSAVARHRDPDRLLLPMVPAFLSGKADLGEANRGSVCVRFRRVCIGIWFRLALWPSVSGLHLYAFYSSHQFCLRRDCTVPADLVTSAVLSSTSASSELHLVCVGVYLRLSLPWRATLIRNFRAAFFRIESSRISSRWLLCKSRSRSLGRRNMVRSVLQWHRYS